LDIIKDVFNQQNKVLSTYSQLLDPETFNAASSSRKMRFQYEKKAIDRILKSFEARMNDCTELRERISRLALQNVQLVETQQEDNSRAILVFTVVTVLFLPMTFVSGFFGMNLVGISGTTSTVRHFWVIGLPVTAGVIILCLVGAYAGAIKRLFQRRKEKST
jgi:Mg2+ and Co2+ transporter CorA